MNQDVNHGHDVGQEERERVALAEAVHALREELARLTDRVVALESATRAQAGAPAGANGAVAGAVALPDEAPPAQPEELSEELVLVISAAIAAFLGKKPYIRQIRLVASPTWLHTGRVSIQASHALAVHHRSGASL